MCLQMNVDLLLVQEVRKYLVDISHLVFMEGLNDMRFLLNYSLNRVLHIERALQDVLMILFNGVVMTFVRLLTIGVDGHLHSCYMGHELRFVSLSCEL